jgi:hypothetical protein
MYILSFIRQEKAFRFLQVNFFLFQAFWPFFTLSFINYDERRTICKCLTPYSWKDKIWLTKDEPCYTWTISYVLVYFSNLKSKAGLTEPFSCIGWFGENNFYFGVAFLFTVIYDLKTNEDYLLLIFAEPLFLETRFSTGLFCFGTVFPFISLNVHLFLPSETICIL